MWSDGKQKRLEHLQSRLEDELGVGGSTGHRQEKPSSSTAGGADTSRPTPVTPTAASPAAGRPVSSIVRKSRYSIRLPCFGRTVGRTRRNYRS